MAPTRIMIDPLLGRDIGGRFVLTHRLAGRGDSATYRAVQRSVGRDVAVKVVHAGGDAALIGRFLEQARLMSRVAHPNVMEVIDAGFTPDGLLYLVSGLVAGRTLADAVAAEGRFELDRVIRIGLQLCDALDAAHARSVMHGDLGPENVMLLPDDSIVVLDFGLTGPTERGGWGDPRADLSALGRVLLELTTGRRPDAGWPSLGQLPRPLAALIHALLSGDPARSPASARQVKAELVAMGKPPAAEPARAVTGVIRRSGALLAPAVRPRRRGLPFGVQLALGAGFGLGFGYALTVLAIKLFDLF